MKLVDNLRIAILISGSGSTMEKVLKACISGELKVNPVLIISSRSDALGIEKAKRLHMSDKDVITLSPKKFACKEAFGEVMLDACRSRRVDVIGQCGWLPLTPENVIEAYEGYIFNQHPGALDPGYDDFGGKGMYGIRVPATSVYFKQAVGRLFTTEATTHRVTKELDKGMILNRCEVEVREDYTPEKLQKILLPKEYSIVKKTFADFDNGTIKEYKRTTRLIQPHEIEILRREKQRAITNYP